VQAPTQCWINVNTRRWIGELGQLSGVLDALESMPGMTPERFGPDERHMKDYARKAVLAKAPKKRGHEWFLMLARTNAPILDGSLAAVEGTKMQFGFERAGLASWEPVFQLADELARRVEPQVLSVAPLFERVAPVGRKDGETINWIVESAATYEPLLRQYGLIGLTFRTYLGPELVELIGRERIESLKLTKKWFGDGVRIDLVDEPWNAKIQDLVKPWRAAMAILRESDVFSTGSVAPSGMVLARRGKRWP
jgi:hypothetical protein